MGLAQANAVKRRWEDGGRGGPPLPGLGGSADPALAALLTNAMFGRQNDDKDKGKPQKVEFGKGPQVHNRKPDGRNCCRADGYSLHANRTVARNDWEGLEKLCKSRKPV